MPTVNELISKVTALLDDTPDTINLINWFNQCQDSLTNILYMPTLVTITRDVPTGLFLIPDNCNGELKILDPEDIETYSIYDNGIYFDGSTETSLTSTQITYNKLPLEITNNPDQIPSIHPRFHDVYVLFACMQAMHPEEEPERYTQYERDYLRMVIQIQKFYGKFRPKPAAWRVVR